MSARATAGFRIGEVQGVTVDVQDCVAGTVANGCIQVTGGIVEKPQGFVVCFVGALGLGCSNGIEGSEHGDVDGNCIVEESPNDLLDKMDSLWRKRVGIVKSFRVLGFGTIDGLRPGVGGILLEFGWVCWNLCSALSM